MGLGIGNGNRLWREKIAKLRDGVWVSDTCRKYITDVRLLNSKYKCTVKNFTNWFELKTERTLHLRRRFFGAMNRDGTEKGKLSVSEADEEGISVGPLT